MTHRSTLALPLAFALLTPACGPKQAPTTSPAPTEPAEPVPPIPEGFHTITPQLTVKGVDEAVAFYEKALGAEKLFAMPGPDGKTLHAEIKLGDTIIMLDEENVEQGAKSPLTLGGTPATVMVYVPDADATYAAAIATGATAQMPVDEQFWGDRYGELVDPYGHRWAVGTHVEDLTDEQMEQRAAIMFAPPDPKAKKKSKKGEAPPAPAWKEIVGTPATQAVPEGYHTVTLAFTMDDANAAIEFYKAAFGATERERMPGPDGKLMHAEIAIGDSVLMMSDEFPEMGSKSAKTLGGSPVAVHMYVEDVDAAVATATESGATAIMPITDMFWGDRYGAVTDVAGYFWGVATHKEDVPPEDMAERMKAQMEPADTVTTPS